METTLTSYDMKVRVKSIDKENGEKTYRRQYDKGLENDLTSFVRRHRVGFSVRGTAKDTTYDCKMFRSSTS